MPAPIYTSVNCRPAYQLDWSYCIFWRDAPLDFAWLEPLRQVSEVDHVRVLEHEFKQPNLSQFLISTQPQVSPKLLVQRVKGRLQHLIRERMPDAFRRNYSLRSVGSTTRRKLDHYLATQLEHHRMADERAEQRLSNFQIHRPEVDLSEPSRTSHALYWYNLHVGFVNDRRDSEIATDMLAKRHDMILRASQSKGHQLARGALLADHVHLMLRCRLEETPEEVALSYMNNLAYASGMKAVFQYSYFGGTFGEYDLGVIPKEN